MTLLGKIFTVMIFVMSCVFMTAAVTVYATHRNWKMMVTNETATERYPLGLKPQLEQLKETNQNLRLEIDSLSNKLAIEQAARRHAIGALQTKLINSRSLLAEKEASLRQLQAAESEMTAAIKIAEENVTALRAEVSGLRDEIRQAQQDRDSQFEKVVNLTDQLHAAKGVEQNLRERQAQLIDQLARATHVLQIHDLDPNKSYAGVAPMLDGVVTAVGDRDLIEVSLGSDDGLDVGQRLEVFRDNAYLGFAIVLKTDPDRAVAKVDEKSKRGLIKDGDRVATKLSRTRTS